MLTFAKQGGFLAILKLLKLENALITESVFKYLKKWLQSEREEKGSFEESDDPERLASKSDFMQRTGSDKGYTIPRLFRTMTSQLIDDLNQGAEEEKKDLVEQIQVEPKSPDSVRSSSLSLSMTKE